MLSCSYCGQPLIGGRGESLAPYRSVPSGLACEDIQACDAREAKGHKAYLSELRSRRRAGDEFSPAEQAALEGA